MMGGPKNCKVFLFSITENLHISFPAVYSSIHNDDPTIIECSSLLVEIFNGAAMIIYNDSIQPQHK